MRKSRIKRIVAQLMAVALLCTQIPQMNKEVYADTIEKRMDAVESIVLGGAHSAAVTKNGDLYCWGSNICGQIGNGTTINQLTPTKIMNNVKNFFQKMVKVQQLQTAETCIAGGIMLMDRLEMVQKIIN